VRRDLGDFQTPPELVAKVLEALGPIGSRWPRVLEPSCGRGHFIRGLLDLDDPPRQIQGIEIQESHFRAAHALAVGNSPHGVPVRIIRGDMFKLDLKRDLKWRENGPLLVVGNPPWVTNSELGSLASTIRPPRRNFKGMTGYEARTGASNFDVAEAFWLKLAYELADQRPTIALLCKTSVARSVLQFAHRAPLSVNAASVRQIDAAHWFGAAVDACLFCLTLGDAQSMPMRSLHVPVYSGLEEREPDNVMGFARGWLVADFLAHDEWAFADGRCPMTWRQGLKHDAAGVMELARDLKSGQWRNRADESVDVEANFVYPLVKGTDLARSSGTATARAVLVTQSRLGDNTARLAEQAPRLWSYLQSNSATFANRKSSIYRGQPAFALFGIGPYSFAPYKVAISGLHKVPKFRALGPVHGRPVMLDDTSYFLPCSTALEAAFLLALCNDPITLGLIGSICFRDAKRPITKKLLQRLDFLAILERADRQSLLARAQVALNDDLAAGPAEAIFDVVEEMERQFRQMNVEGA
jgi:hypothetical protein